MATVYLSLSPKDPFKNGTHEILVRFCHGNINQRAKSGIFVNAEYWNNSLQQISMPKFRVMSDEQKSIIEDLSKIQNDLQDLQAIITRIYKGRIRESCFAQ